MSPAAPPRPCAYPLCSNLVFDGARCPEHERQSHKADSQRRGSARDRGYTARWDAYSKRFLQRNPLCALCLKVGQFEVAEMVDHVVPVTGPDDPGFWNPENHQALSFRSHRIKTAEDVRKGLTR